MALILCQPACTETAPKRDQCSFGHTTFEQRLEDDLRCIEFLADISSTTRPEVRRERTVPPARLPERTPPVKPFESLNLSDGVWLGPAGSITFSPDGLFQSLNATAGPLITQPLIVTIDESMPLKWRPETALTPSAGSLRWRSVAEHKQGTLSLTGTYHFDGLLTFRLDWQGEPDASIADVQLVLDEALAQHVVSRVFNRDTKLGTRSHQVIHDLVSHEHLALSYTPQLSLGSDRHAALLLTTSGESFRTAENPEPLRIALRDKRLQLSMVWPLGATNRSLEFAIQALPLRRGVVQPHRSELLTAQVPDAIDLDRRMRNGKVGKLSNEFPPIIIVHQGWSGVQGYPDTSDPQRLARVRDFVAEAHRRNSRVLLYLGAELPTTMPNWPEHAKRALAFPLRPGRTRDSVPAWRPAGGQVDWVDEHVTAVRRLLAETDADGLFLDTLGDVRASVNPWVGLGYRRSDGALQPEYAWFENRRWLLRLADAVHSHSNAGFLACHVSGVASPGQGVCDLLLVGETELAVGRRQGIAAYLDRLSLPRLRALYNPHRRGIPMQWLVKPERGGAALQRVSASVSQLDIPVRVQWPHFIGRTARHSMLNPVDEMLEHWRLRRNNIPSATWVPYWEAQPVAYDAPDGIVVSSRISTDGVRLDVSVSNLDTTEQCVVIEAFETHARREVCLRGGGFAVVRYRVDHAASGAER